MPHASFAPAAITNRPDRPSLEANLAPSPGAPERGRTRRAAVFALVALGVFAASLTESTPQRPEIVSGRAQPKTSPMGAEERWWKSTVTVTLDGSLADLGASGEDAVKEGFGTWLGGDQKLPKLRFDSSGRKALVLTPDGENRVYYAPITIPGHENDLAITLAYTRADTGEVTEADIVINSKHNFGVLAVQDRTVSSGKNDDSSGSKKSGSAADGQTSAKLSTSLVAPNCQTTYDVQSVVTHEIGHFFGLGEDMTDAAATMYFSTAPCDLGKRDLLPTDATEITSLYATTFATGDSDDGSSTSPTAAAKCSVSSPGTRSSDGLPWALVAAGLALVARQRRARRAR